MFDLKTISSNSSNNSNSQEMPSLQQSESIYQQNYVFDWLPGLCIIPDVASTEARANNNNNCDDSLDDKQTTITYNHRDGSVGNLDLLLPRIRHNSATLPSLSTSTSSRSSSLSSISSSTNNDQLEQQATIDFDNLADNPNAVQLVFKSTLSDEKEIEWKASLINETNLYVDIPANHLTEGTRDSFVSLLEFAEDKLNCERVFVFLNKSRTDRSSLMNAFRFFGFKPVAPGNKYAPQNENLLTMVYEIEQ